MRAISKVESMQTLLGCTTKISTQISAMIWNRNGISEYAHDKITSLKYFHSLAPWLNSQLITKVPGNQATVNREYFVVKIFSDSLAYAKIKRTKHMYNINDHVVQGHLSGNYLIRKLIAWDMKIFAIYGTYILYTPPSPLPPPPSPHTHSLIHTHSTQMHIHLITSSDTHTNAYSQ